MCLSPGILKSQHNYSSPITFNLQPILHLAGVGMPCGLELLTAKAATALAFPRWGCHLFQVGSCCCGLHRPPLHCENHCLCTDHLSVLPLLLLHHELPSSTLTKKGREGIRTVIPLTGPQDGPGRVSLSGPLLWDLAF